MDEDSSGQRLDNYLFRQLKGVPKTHIYRIIRSGEVRINKGRAGADSKLVQGDVLRIPPVRVSELESRQGEQITPSREFPILYEDDFFLAIHKPAGVAVHGGSGVQFGVIEQMRNARPREKCLELVHRLDRETSGVLLIAKRRSSLRHLQDQFRERETDKTYVALVKGAWPVRKKVLDQALHKYLLPDGERRVRVVAADHPDAMRSITLVKQMKTCQVPLQGLPAFSEECVSTLLEVCIKTGRTHQIRVHLASAGHPIAGDDKYGDFNWNRLWQKSGHKRMFLHALKLRIQHPTTDEMIELKAPLPDDLQRMLAGAKEFHT